GNGQVFPLPRGEFRPTLEGKPARDSRCTADRDQRRLDGDGPGSAERIAERFLAVVACAEEQRSRECLTQRRFRLRPAPSALVQQRAAGIDADGADVVVEAGEEELRVRRRFLAGTLDARNR